MLETDIDVVLFAVLFLAKRKYQNLPVVRQHAAVELPLAHFLVARNVQFLGGRPTPRQPLTGGKAARFVAAVFVGPLDENRVAVGRDAVQAVIFFLVERGG